MRGDIVRLQISKTKNAASFYVVKSVYANGKRTNKVVEKLGTYEELKTKLGDKDPYEWASEYVLELNKKEKEGQEPDVIAKYSPHKRIEKDVRRSFNGGYLFLQQIYYELKLHELCRDISKKYKFKFNLDNILSRLIYGRILFPLSKLATYEESKKFIEQPDFNLHQIYRALSYLAKETDLIQSTLYNNSLKVSKRNTSVLFYDCTNFYFEIEEAKGIRQYGAGKEHRPNPITQMGLFMDGDGIPLALSINRGNMNEQLTLKPLEKKILSDFNLSRFVVCTDAGLSSEENRRFNNKNERAFITTQSIKKLKKHLKNWALDNTEWNLPGSEKTFDISKLDEMIEKSDEKAKRILEAKVFYKERWINENGLEQKLIVTYSVAYRNYLREIRNSQIERAMKAINENPQVIKRHGQNDYKRFVTKTSITSDGEIASKELFDINTDLIEKEGAFDGFYGVCTNLDDDVSEIIKVNRRRWEIEECFRIMKSEFKARPVYLSDDERIEAHFITCFISLVIYRLLEKRLKGEFTCTEIISELREMNFKEIKGEGYEPIYMRTDFTDALHEACGFHTDYQIVTLTNEKNF